MSPEEKELARARLANAFQTRGLYRKVYKSDDAIVTLAQMMDEAGYYSTNPETINPALIASVNRLLNSMGAVHPYNTFNFAKAIVGTANDDDLVNQQRMIESKEE